MLSSSTEPGYISLLPTMCAAIYLENQYIHQSSWGHASTTVLCAATCVYIYIHIYIASVLGPSRYAHVYSRESLELRIKSVCKKMDLMDYNNDLIMICRYLLGFVSTLEMRLGIVTTSLVILSSWCS